jgi:hypothetical protein
MSLAAEEISKRVEKVEKILALVARGATEGERGAAAHLIARYLAEHPLPIQWCVPQGTVCQIVPAHYLGDLREAKAIIRSVALHRREVFPERLRVRVNDEVPLSMGYLYFERHGYAIFVKVSDVTVRL